MERAARVAFALALSGLVLGQAVDQAFAQDASSYPVAGRTLRLITPH
jgi:hypothetical protein